MSKIFVQSHVLRSVLMPNWTTFSISGVTGLLKGLEAIKDIMNIPDHNICLYFTLGHKKRCKKVPYTISIKKKNGLI